MKLPILNICSLVPDQYWSSCELLLHGFRLCESCEKGSGHFGWDESGPFLSDSDFNIITEMLVSGSESVQI